MQVLPYLNKSEISYSSAGKEAPYLLPNSSNDSGNDLLQHGHERMQDRYHVIVRGGKRKHVRRSAAAAAAVVIEDDGGNVGDRSASEGWSEATGTTMCS